ncbi:unnamed protein product [Clonostachys rosea]|uniref:Aminoglycoside phosphotransferase domain-containing protein n=1 Tax=Bionectria ochroleuca TaxID=29856 RepID=A0ABY6V3L7_BIOOC|nr:unnamed protein product [Clonostachys rosea]
MPNSASSIESYDSDEPPPLNINLEQLMASATGILQAQCTGAVPMARGANHEVFLLSFEPSASAHPGITKSDYRCVARFTRENSANATTRDASEVSTLQYLKRETDIPVPEIFHQDLNMNNPVGAPYTLMEHLKGRHLYKLWNSLSLDFKKAVLSQVAAVVAKLSSLRFESIGSFDGQGSIGPLVSQSSDIQKGPFSSTEEFVLSFVSTNDKESPELVELFQEIQEALEIFFSETHNPALRPPYAMVHTDFDGQNMLFIEQPDHSPPKLSGIIDFEYSYAGPLYFLYEYPIFIQDVSWSKELYAQNSILRPHFIREIYKNLPDEESRMILTTCMNRKSFTLNSFQTFFMSIKSPEEDLIDLARSYLKSLREGTHPPYLGRLDFVPEFYLPDGSLAP